MAATIEILRAGANSASFFTKSDGANPAIDLTYWNQLPEGRLRDLMTQSYDSQEAFMRAFAAEGGSVTVVTEDSSDAYQSGFYYAALPAPPVFEVYTTDPATVRVSLAYSASE